MSKLHVACSFGYGSKWSVRLASPLFIFFTTIHVRKGYSSKGLSVMQKYLEIRREVYCSSAAMPVPSAVVSGVDIVGNCHPGICKPNESSTENARTTSTDHPSNHLAETISSLNDMLRTAEEKVNLAKATYDSASHVHQLNRHSLLTRNYCFLPQVDRHVRLLDQAIQEHESRFPSVIPHASASRVNTAYADFAQKGRNTRVVSGTELRDRSAAQGTPRSMRNRRPPEGSVIARHGAMGGLVCFFD